MKYVVDELALKRGITVLRLPPYHCELNPIELVWAQVKGEVAQQNTSFKLRDVEKLLISALNNVTAEKWKKCVEHVLKVETNMWQLDDIVENVIEPVIINDPRGRL